MNVPRLAKGKGFSGPDHYGCCNTGNAPAIFHSRTGKYVVGPITYCRDAMAAGITFTDARKYGEGSRRVWIYKSRGPAIAKFRELATIIEQANAEMRRQHAELARRAAAGDLEAAAALGDF